MVRIKLWTFQKAPARFREFLSSDCEWLAHVPHALIVEGTALFRRSEMAGTVVIKHPLPDGSLVLGGSSRAGHQLRRPRSPFCFRAHPKPDFAGWATKSGRLMFHGQERLRE